jgi:hypothetical protein
VAGASANCSIDHRHQFCTNGSENTSFFFFSTPEVKVYSKEIDEHKNLAIRMRNKKENGDKKREAMAIE